MRWFIHFPLYLAWAFIVDFGYESFSGGIAAIISGAFLIGVGVEVVADGIAQRREGVK